MTTASSRLNHNGSMRTAATAPRTAPGRVHRPSVRLSRKSAIPLRRNSLTEVMFWASRAIRLVPLAVAGDMPMKIMAGMVSSEPPPAITLMNPATTPTAIRIRWDEMSRLPPARAFDRILYCIFDSVAARSVERENHRCHVHNMISHTHGCHPSEWVGVPHPAWRIDSPGVGNSAAHRGSCGLQPNNCSKYTCQILGKLAPVVR